MMASDGPDGTCTRIQHRRNKYVPLKKRRRGHKGEEGEEHNEESRE